MTGAREVTRWRMPWYGTMTNNGGGYRTPPLYLYFVHIHLLIARIAHNWHLPFISIIAYR